MTFASGAQHGLSYVSETTFGTTPAIPTMLGLRHNSCGLILNKDTLESDEIRDDRQIGNFLHGNRRASGPIAFELSYGSFDDLLQAALQGAWSTDVLIVGKTQPSFSMERRFTDINQYQLFTGCCVNAMSLSIQPNSIVTGQFDMIGSDMVASGTSVDAVPAALSTNDPFDSFSGTLQEGGSNIGIVTGLELSIDNGLNPSFVIGDAKAAQITAGKSRVTGTLTTYFENITLLNKFVNKTKSSLKVTLVGDGGQYDIEMNNVVYNGADNPVNGADNLTISMPFVGLYDSTAGTSIKVTRTAI